MAIQVAFIDVGRDKKSWVADIGIDDDGFLSERDMVKTIKQHGALGSRGIDFLESGEILVGGFRCVGRFKVQGVQP